MTAATPEKRAAASLHNEGDAVKLNHANLFTSDVDALSGILIRHFAFKPEHAGEGFAMLRGSDGFSLVLMTIGPESSRTYPSADVFDQHISFHIGFIVDTPEHVHAKHEDLRENGCRPGPIKTFDAIGKRWTAFYCPVGDGIDIEVTAHA